jgi:hypothetical protein
VGQEAGLSAAARRRPRPSSRSIAAICVAACAALAHGAVCANDRPFLLTSNAAAEEDDDQVWSVETWWQRRGSERVFSVAPEYAFNPTTSLQLELARASGNAKEVELEFKHLFNHIARDGWGWGVHLAADMASSDESGWRTQGASIRLLHTLQLHDGAAMLHLNAGLKKERDERREWVASAAFEHQLPWRISAFVETGREDRQTLLHAGVRHWIRREKLALDIAVQRTRGGGEKASGVVIGIAWYDL